VNFFDNVNFCHPIVVGVAKKCSVALS